MPASRAPIVVVSGNGAGGAAFSECAIPAETGRKSERSSSTAGRVKVAGLLSFVAWRRAARVAPAGLVVGDNGNLRSSLGFLDA